MMARDKKSVWPDNSPQNKRRSQSSILHGLVIIALYFKDYGVYEYWQLWIKSQFCPMTPNTHKKVGRSDLYFMDRSFCLL